EDAEDGRVIHWRLEDLDHATVARHSLIALLAGTIVAGWVAWGTRGTAEVTWAFGGIVLATTVVVSVLSLVAHEGLHGIVMAMFGARPQFGAGRMETPEVDGKKGAKVPYLFATAPGHHFTPTQMNIVALAPTFIVSAAFLVAIAALPGPWAAGLVLPAGLHLSGCVGDWQVVALMRQQPAGTSVEDTRDGMILHRP
ncbi:MAG: DUF3267 domain-containing protein, partial [Actinomycetia bacterium]|nr:DUF3267 domain-containing protein [Actinomycetes bacterium]